MRIDSLSLTDYGFRKCSSAAAARVRPAWADFAVQLVERGVHAREDLPSARGQAVDAGAFRPLRVRGAEPAALRHARENRIQRARAQAVAVMAQLLEHPV